MHRRSPRRCPSTQVMPAISRADGDVRRCRPASAGAPQPDTVAGVTESLDRSATDTTDAVIAEALAVIDQALGQMLGRELVSSNEMADVLLDVRSALTPPTAEPV
jgi:hypothetical protein